MNIGESRPFFHSLNESLKFLDLVDEMVDTDIKFPFLIPNNVFFKKPVLLSFIYNLKL